MNRQRKAILSAAIAGVGTLSTALADASVMAQEWAAIVLATLAGYAGVYRIRNGGKVPNDG